VSIRNASDFSNLVSRVSLIVEEREAEKRDPGNEVAIFPE